MAETKNTPLVDIRHLKKYFNITVGAFQTKPLKAVDDVSFFINKGETLGLVGESGCGKTTVGRTILQLYKPTGGEIYYDGKPVKTKRDLKEFRTKATMVFQDPYSSLNPRMTVSDIIAEPLDVHDLCKTKEERRERVLELMNYVGLNSEHASRYAHEFSGGQRQRIGIARALAVKPRFIVCDEAVSALDVSVRAQILNLLEELQEDLKLTYVFVSHDLSVIEHICTRVAIMYLGRIVEVGTKEQIFTDCRHPYTRALLSAIPTVDDGARRERILLEGSIPSPVDPPEGCRFHTRCPEACEACRQDQQMIDVGGGHLVCCWRCTEQEQKEKGNSHVQG